MSEDEYAGGSNNTNKLSPQEQKGQRGYNFPCSNNTNKLSPQERYLAIRKIYFRSNNTNKLSPQEHGNCITFQFIVQIIQINLALKNGHVPMYCVLRVQIIQINLALKN